MGESNLVLNIMLKARDQASSVFKNVAGALGKINPVAGAVAVGAMALGAAVVGVGVVATKMAADFQTAMLSNVAHAGLAKSQFNSVSQAVLKMASDVGRSPTQLAEALYPILSGFSNITNQSAKSSLALATLKLSFEAVAGTTVNGTDVANAAVGTFNALGLSTNNAATNTARMTGLMDVMDKTVQLGNMQWDAYKNVISKLAVSVQGTGVSFNEASAALSTMTNEGFSAQKAQTYLSNMFTTMAIKTDTLAKHAKALKISFDEQKYSSMSLADKIGYLNQVTDGNKQKILALLGNNATALKSFNALSTGIGGYKSNLVALNHAHGALALSFQTASQGFSFSMSRIKASVDAVMIGIGTKLLPVLSQLANAVIPLIAAFAAWVNSSGGLQTALNAVTGVIGTMATTVSGALGYMSQQSSASMLNMKNDAIGKSLSQAQGVVANIEYQRRGIEDEMQHTSSASERHMLQMKLNALGTSLDQAKGVVKNYQTQRAGVEQQLSMATSAAALKTLQAKQVSVSNSLAQARGVIANYQMQRRDLEDELQHTSDATQRHMIEMKIKAIDTSLQHEQGVVKNFTKEKTEVTSQVTQMKSNLEAQQNNILLRIGGFVNGAIGFYNRWKPAILGVAAVITAFFIPAMIKSGVQAVIAGAKVAISYVKNIIMTGVEAYKSVGKILVWIGSMAASGAKAVWAGAKIAAGFVANLIKAGAQAVLAGAKITAEFVGSLIKAGAQAVLTGIKFVANLVPAIISVATQAVIAAATAIPGLVIGFGTWAIGAASAAVATLAAAAPVLLIIGAIALLVVGIILLATHWKQVVAFLRGAWQAFSSWFMGALHAVGAFFSNIWNGIVSFAKAAWHLLVANAGTIFTILMAVILGPIGLVVALIITHWTQIRQFLSNIWNGIVSLAKTLWNKLVSTITGIITTLKTWATNFWDDEKKGWQKIWDTVKNIVTTGWNDVLGFFTGAFTTIKGWAATFWDDEKRGWQRIWDTVKQLVTDGWNKVVALFTGATDRVHTAISSLWANISTFFGGLPAKMVTFGQKMISGLISGITGMAGNLASAVTGLLKHIPGVGAVAGFLHIPGFASGVQNFHGGVALVGENGPELVQLPGGSNVIPLDYRNNGVGSVSGVSGNGSASGASGGGNTIIVLNNTLIVPQGTPKQQAEAIYEELDKLMAKKQRRLGITSNSSSGSAA